MTLTTSTMRVVSPTRARTWSPGETMVAGFASRSLTRTCPPRQAEAASGRVLDSRTAHNHRSTRVESTGSIMLPWLGDHLRDLDEIAARVVEYRGRHVSHVGGLLGESHPEPAQPFALG